MENIKELVKYNVTDAALQQYRDEFLPLTINGIDDHEGYDKVKDARLFIKGERVNVEKRRVEFKADALEYGRAVDAEAKRITASLVEVEGHLEAEQRKIDDEKARIKFEREQREKLPARVQALSNIGEAVDESVLLKLNDAGFADLLNRLTAEKLERQRLAQEKIEREQRAEQDRIDAEKKAIEQARLEAEREKQRQAELEQAKKEAAEQARLDAEREAQRKETARLEAERQAKAEAERIEAEKPDKEKLADLSIRILNFPLPEVSTKRAQAKLAKVRKLIDEIVAELHL